MKNLFEIIVFSALVYTGSGQSLITKNLVWDGNNREYAVYLPESYDGNLDFPLVFNFHGGGDYINNWMNTVDMRPIADTANFILVYPQAFPDPTDGGSPNWVRKPPTAFDDVPFVDAMINSLLTEYNINQERIYACGYSLGGEFTYELACSLNSRIAAVGVVARTKYIETFNNCSPVHSTGVMSILGTDDFISNYDGITFGGIQYYLSADETHDYWVVHNDCVEVPEVSTVANTDISDGSTVERNSWTDSEGCKYVEHLKVLGGGHDWPGDFGNMDINSSQEIWNFVSRYSIDGLIDCNSTSVDQSSLSESSYNPYPNPFKDQIIVESNMTGQDEYRIYSIFGTLVLSGRLNSDLSRIDVSSLTSNVYILKIGDESIRIIKSD